MPINPNSISETLTLESRKKLIELILSQDKEIREIFIEAVDDLVEKIRELERTGSTQRIEDLFADLKTSSEIVEERLKLLLYGGIGVAINAGLHQSKQMTHSLLNGAKIDWEPMERSYFRVYTDAVEAMKARTFKGLDLSDRIWGQGQKVRVTLGSLITEAIEAGENPVKVAEVLQKYVRDGANSLTSEYPEMMRRIEYLPNDLSYEALRLARTEMAAAYGEGSIKSAELNPANVGIRWSVSNAGVACDVCVGNAERVTDLGIGVYKVEELPDYPAHPNCLCNLQQVVEDVVEYARRVKEWTRNPQSQPDIEHWYKSVYLAGR